ncbi:MAG: hypothetical protein RL381_884 [Actinomycetota bacterium]|jgi:para-aminobenzoate synthetase component 1
MTDGDSLFWMGGIEAASLTEVTDDASRLDDGSFWAIIKNFEGNQIFARFDEVRNSTFTGGGWNPIEGAWTSSLSRTQYVDYVERIRSEIADGSVYQVNACRVLSSQEQASISLRGLFSEIQERNHSELAAYLKVGGLEIASASPERFIRREGCEILTSPIKGTIREDEDIFGEKDRAENLMIVDLMRNDFGAICAPGTVEVKELFRHEKHPTITHLVSDVIGTLQERITWREILESIAPPGSVSGAPKSSALRIISENESNRGPYCGILGWIQGDRAELSVAIRTFWSTDSRTLHFGTGAGITWASDANSEWEETELKARHLISIAGGDL